MSELCAYDIDGTIREGSLLGDAVVHGVKEGFINQERFADPLQPHYNEVDYFVEAITGRSRTVFNEMTDWLADSAHEQTMPWALDRLEHQRQQGLYRALISHSPDFVVKAYARGLGVEHGHGSFFHTKDLVFSGRSSLRNKVRTVTSHVRIRQLGGIAFAAGDSTYDVPMLLRANHAAVVNPPANLQQLAIKHNWEVINT